MQGFLSLDVVGHALRASLGNSNPIIVYHLYRQLTELPIMHTPAGIHLLVEGEHNLFISARFPSHVCLHVDWDEHYSSDATDTRSREAKRGHAEHVE